MYLRLLNHALATSVQAAQGRPVTLDEFVATQRSLWLPQRGDLVRLLRRSKVVRYNPQTHELSAVKGDPPPR